MTKRFLNCSQLRTKFLLVAILVLVTGCSASSTTEAALPGQLSTWNGFARYDFEVDGKPVIVIAPHEAAAGNPWLWHGEFFGHRPNPDIALLGRGFHIVAMKIPDLFGAPQAVEHWNKLYELLTEQHGFSSKPALVGVSRGGLYCYNWAAANPHKVSCIYGDAPVCDLKSWPLGQGTGTGNAGEIPKLLKVYGVDSIEALLAEAVSPIDQLEPLAEAGVPLLHVYGDADQGVPWEENTGVVAERYQKLGGEITLIAKPGVGHVHGLDDSTPIIEFIAQHCLQSTNANSGESIEIGSRRELFVDRLLIDELENARLRLHEPRPEAIAVQLDKPWEGPFSNYTTLIKDGDRFLMYYRGVSQSGRDGNENERTCVAFSSDGITWTKPELGLYEFNGSTANNIVLANAAPVTHNFTPLLDANPNRSPQEKFKAIGGTSKGLYAYASPDGINWNKLQPEPVIANADVTIENRHLFDSQNLAFWSPVERCYICYFRVWDGVRRIARMTSDDFRKWSNPQLMQYVHDDGTHGPQSAPVEQFYTNQTSPYLRAPHISLAIPARFFPGRQVLSKQQAEAIGVNPGYFKDTSDAVLMSTRGGTNYDRTFLEGYMKPGIGPQNWVSRTNYPALNVMQTGPEELSVYVNQDYAQPTAHVRRYSLRLDGFASVSAGAIPGELLTHPLIFSGNRLSLNFATSAGGGIRIELQDESGMPFPGFALADCQEQIGNEIERIVAWKSGTDVSSLAGQSVRLRIVLTDADLFAFQFQE